MPTPLIEFPDSEGLVIDYLASVLPANGITGVAVAGRKPAGGG